MSDFAKERRLRARRGSLLDHADDPRPSRSSDGVANTGPANDGLANGDRVLNARSAPPASLLSAAGRTPRISTSRFAAEREPVPVEPRRPPPEHRIESRRPPPERRAETDAPQPAEPFGDRIARLIGKVAPRQDRPEPASAADTAPGPASSPASAPDRRPDRPADASRSDAGRNPPPRYRQDHGDQHDWQSAGQAAWHIPDQRPLLDASILIAAVWRFRYLIAVATFIGALIGVMMALATPHKYYAESRLFVDPREVQVTEDDVRNQQLSTEAMLAIIDSQLQILSSTGVLQKVIADLGLERDPEFNGSLPTAGIGAGINLIREIFTGKDPASDAGQKALEELRDAVSVSRDSKTFVIIVGVDTRDPEKSALIANSIVSTYLDSEGEAQSGLLERTSEAIDTRINALRQDLDEAEREVERFKAENGIVGVGGQFIDDKEILAISDQLANARAVKVGIRVKAQNLAKADPDAVLSGAFPEEFLSSNLVDLRKQYTQTKQTAEALATRLGPRHPQYVSAKSSMDTIRSEISSELRRIVASSQAELQRAVETEQELASQMAVAKSRAMDQSVEFVTLRELQRKATATREIYEAFLKRSRETSERSNLSTRNVRVISPAESPLSPMGPSRKFIAIGGMLAGFFAGLGLALLVGAVESIRSYNSGAVQARLQNPPFGHYPIPPDPGPRTPPQGPARRPMPTRDHDEGGFAAAADYDVVDRSAGYRAEAAHKESVRKPSRAETDGMTAQSAPIEYGGGHTASMPSQSHQPAARAPQSRPAIPSTDAGPAHADHCEPAQPQQVQPRDMPRPSQPLWSAYPAHPAPVHPASGHPAQAHPAPLHPDHGYAAAVTSPFAPPSPVIAEPYSAAMPPLQVATVPGPGYQPDQAGQAGPHPWPASGPNPPHSHPVNGMHSPAAYGQAPQMPHPQPIAPPAHSAAYPGVHPWHGSAPYPAPPYPQPASPVAYPVPGSTFGGPQQAWPPAQPAAYPQAEPGYAPPRAGQTHFATHQHQDRGQPGSIQPGPAQSVQAFERIRRDMDALRSRIGGYAGARRRA
jgi:succinoglycan biosynthesis transport protein ExoP